MPQPHANDLDVLDPHAGQGFSRRTVLGAGLGAAAAGARGELRVQGESKAGGDGPPAYGTGINEGFDGKIELDVRD